jgi:alkylhydroperoxidase/carboxymuconolactone decarboxylase family protein YurZ
MANDVFGTCKENTLDAKTSEMIRYAVHLVNGNAPGAAQSAQKAHAAGLSAAQLHRVACLSACSAGIHIQGLNAAALNTVPGFAAPVPAAAPVPPAAPVPAAATPIQLQKGAFNACSSTQLDTKTTHLVALAACLASRCACAQGHILAARAAGASDAELARSACIAACTGGLHSKISFAQQLAASASF